MKRGGFTLIELILVMGILALLFSMMTISFVGVQGRNALAGGVDVLVADLRSQQAKAMTGTTSEGAIQAGYGIHFGSSSYTLFAGDSYVEGAVGNTEVMLPQRVEIAPGSTTNEIVFLRASGEVKDYLETENMIELVNSGESEGRVVRVNELGVVVEGI